VFQRNATHQEMFGNFWWMRDLAWATDPHWIQATRIYREQADHKCCIEDLRNAGITDIGIVLGNVMPEKVQELLGDGWKFRARFTFILQGEPKGITYAVDCAKDFMDD